MEKKLYSFRDCRFTCIVGKVGGKINFTTVEGGGEGCVGAFSAIVVDKKCNASCGLIESVSLKTRC